MWPHAAPAVSVALITYNHEPFVGQAIESVLMQEMTLPYELIIGEDCSTDGTRAVADGLTSRHADRVRLLPAEPNLGVTRNLARTIRACRGRYVALLEGDDYWSSPYKLQRQVAFLGQHPECAICFHAVMEHYEDGSAPTRQPASRPEVLDLEDLFAQNFSYTCTTMFRNGLFGDFPDWFFRLRLGDYPLFVLIARHGKIGFIDEVMATYRVHAGGIWSSQTRARQLRDELEMLRVLDAHLGSRYHRAIRCRSSQLYYKLALAHERAGGRTQALTALVSSLRQRPANGAIPRWGRARLAARILGLRPHRWIQGFQDRLGLGRR